MTYNYKIWGLEIPLNLSAITLFAVIFCVVLSIIRYRSLMSSGMKFLNDFGGVFLFSYASRTASDGRSKNIMRRDNGGIQSTLFDITSDIQSLLFINEAAIKIIFLRRTTLMLALIFGVAALTLWSMIGTCEGEDCRELAAHLRYSLLQVAAYFSFYLAHCSLSNRWIVPIEVFLLFFALTSVTVSTNLFKDPYLYEPHLVYLLHLIITIYLIIGNMKHLSLRGRN